MLEKFGKSLKKIMLKESDLYGAVCMHLNQYALLRPFCNQLVV